MSNFEARFPIAADALRHEVFSGRLRAKAINHQEEIAKHQEEVERCVYVEHPENFFDIDDEDIII